MSRLSYLLSALAVTVGLTGCFVEPSDSEISTTPYYEVVQQSAEETVIEGFLDQGQSFVYPAAMPSDVATYDVELTADADLDLGVNLGGLEQTSAGESGDESVNGTSIGVEDELEAKVIANQASAFVLRIRVQRVGPAEGIGTSP